MSAALVCLSAWSAQVLAATGYQLGTGVSHSDNIARLPAGEIDDTVGSASTSFVWNRNSGPLAAEASGQLTYLDYFQDTFDEELLPSLDAEAMWTILPARLSWALSDKFGQVTTDPFEALTPENRENINYLSTGPDLLLGSNPSQLLTLSLRFEDQYYEESDIDNQRIRSGVMLERQLSNQRSVSLNGTAEAVEFDNGMRNADFDIYEIFARYESRLLGSTVSVDAGYSELELNDQTSDGILTRISLLRDLTPNWNLQLSGERSFSDSGNRFLAGREESSAGAGQGANDALAVATPLRLLALDVDLSRRDLKSEFGIGLRWEDEDFETSNAFDRREIGGTLALSRNLTPLMSVIAGLEYEETEFASGSRMDEDMDISIRLRRRLTRGLSIDFRVAQLQRVSTEESSEYREIVYGIGLVYAGGLLQSLRSTAP